MILLLAPHVAMAFPPSAEDRRRFAGRILDATRELTASARPDAAKARRHCAEARDIARRFDANDYWFALVEDCLAAVSDFEKDKVAACNHYAAAAERYVGARSDSRARSVDADLERIRTALTRLGCAIATATPPPLRILGPLSPADLKEVVARVAAAHASLLGKDPKAAREVCNEARDFAARFTHNEYAAGVVEECFADVEIFEQDKGVACTRYGLAMTHYASVRAGDTGAEAASSQLRRLKRVRRKHAC
ncbi:MAG: hypothetical protein HY056_15040 [Proteobacteria bacterium]|nr:hypothetical protein [Pseudomonadota bacterium]